MKQSIFLQSLAIETKIGIHPNEKKAKQTILLDIKLSYNGAKAMISDEINDALDYDLLAKHCRKFAKHHQFDLVESFAYQLSKSIFKHFDCEKIKIKISKKGLIENCEAYGLSAKFNKSDFKSQ